MSQIPFLKWETIRSHGEAFLYKREYLLTRNSQVSAEGGFELMAFPAVGTQETSRLGSVPLMFSDSLVWTSPSERLGSTDQSHPFLQLPTVGLDVTSGDNGPLKEPAERRDSGPKSISRRMAAEGGSLYQSLFCNAVGSLSSTVRAAEEVYAKTPLIFQNSVASSPKTDALR